MTDQLNQDVRKAVEDVLKERDEVAIRQETEDALLKSAEKINELVASLEAKDGEMGKLSSRIEELMATVAELSDKIKSLETEKQGFEKEKSSFQAEKDDLLKKVQASEDALNNIKKDQLAKTRFEDLKNNGVAVSDPKAVEEQVAKVREMADDQFEAYKNERVELRKAIIAELEKAPAPAPVAAAPAPVVDPAAAPAPVADAAIVEEKLTEEEIAAAVEPAINPMSAVAAALNLETVPTEGDKAKYNKLGEELAKRIKERKDKKVKKQ